MDPRVQQLLGGLPDIFAKYVDQPWWNAYKQMFEEWQQNPSRGGQVTLPPMVNPTPQVPTQPTSYAPFSGALPGVAAVNPWGLNNHTAYDNRGDMDARMALGGAGAQYQAPRPPVTYPRPPQQPTQPRPPVVVQPRPPQTPGGPANPVPTQPRPPVGGYVPTTPPNYGGGWNYGPGTQTSQWPNFGRGYTPATNSSYANGYAETGSLLPGQQNMGLMRPQPRRQPRTFTGWG